MKPQEIIYENSADRDYDIYSASQKLVALLSINHLKLSTAESCTGGLIGGAITMVSGASEVFEEGYITYANSAKEKLLGVTPQTLKEYGAVSTQTAYEMAKGVSKASGSDLGISVTGIAGPGGGTPEKPVGLVYIGISLSGSVTVYECHFSGNRDCVRNATVYTALKKATEKLEDMLEKQKQ